MLFESLVRGDHVGTGFCHEPETGCSVLRWFVGVVLDGFLQDKEGYDEVLGSGVAERIKTGHEPEEGLQLLGSEIPVLLEQEQGQRSRDFLSSETKGEITLLRVIEASTCILVLLQFED